MNKKKIIVLTVFLFLLIALIFAVILEANWRKTNSELVKNQIKSIFINSFEIEDYKSESISPEQVKKITDGYINVKSKTRKATVFMSDVNWTNKTIYIDVLLGPSKSFPHEEMGEYICQFEMKDGKPMVKKIDYPESVYQ